MPIRQKRKIAAVDNTSINKPTAKQVRTSRKQDNESSAQKGI